MWRDAYNLDQQDIRHDAIDDAPLFVEPGRAEALPLPAERLIVAGFFAEVFDRLPAHDLRASLDAAVAAKVSSVLA